MAASNIHFGATSEDWRAYTWSYEPDKTADWYGKHGKPLPELAPALTTVEQNKSYIVKLECVGCPFRVRREGELVETWQEPPQENSLLMNFTIDDSKANLLLNGDAIAPLAPMPLHITTYQTPANLTGEIMGKIESMKMLDESWAVGTKYGLFELQYEHTQLATEVPYQDWVQFDITTIHMRQTHNPGSYDLDKDGQKIVQLLVSREIVDSKPTLMIKDIQLLERKDRAQPVTMPCGKKAMIKTEFNPLQWDYYGKFGTTIRKVHVILWRTAEFFEENALPLIIVSLFLGGYSLGRWLYRRSRAQAVAQVKGDVEAARLAPPEYTDELQTEN
ncbi:hypothetical protein K469DRAFT_611775 [Zopfia rhizophila CBS 207.26]|uniref:Uncharacterized protein n=1 Tax=Zopfia rhizophila CBS 207.26 TaxID=1314779 RepID=A0A6A6D6W7_9PEZI|nr:hypothetical protein K469DRAFT_611775 [Zopfia rhizophila CBS 207.26]